MKTFSDSKAPQKSFGAVGAKKIALRLQQLAAAPTLADMRDLPGRCHQLPGDLDGLLAVDVHHPYRLLFRATTQVRKYDGGLDWSLVEGVTIVRVEDYH